ncbi:MAG: enamine deaminase RidA [Flavobacteriales bacterium]|nr:enamine deaminase RidA [Flavobacteriales bacterium]|tara:strand:- start:168 stop:614 length:447 start_codon:yes stop_codon:yes gene_type:complete
MKKLIILLLIVTSCNSPQISKKNIEHINSDEHLTNDYPFSEATIVNDIIYVSGQIGSSSNGEVVSGGIEAETLQALQNIETILKRIGGSKSDIFKCTCMLKDINDWPSMSKTYKSFFDDLKLPSRSAFAGSGLALGALVEIECLAIRN